MPKSAYPSFCPVAMASEILEPRWTMLILCEMWSGSHRFNQIQRGVPGMSPGLLSRRLKDMEQRGLIDRRRNGTTGHVEYLTTQIADELQPVIRQLGEWAHRNVNSDLSLGRLDARVLMWNIRRKINRLELPPHKTVVQFILKHPASEDVTYWLVFQPGLEADLCFTDPGFNVDLFIVAELSALTSAWMGHSSFREQIEADRITLIGHEAMARTLSKWMITSSYSQG